MNFRFYDCKYKHFLLNFQGIPIKSSSEVKNKTKKDADSMFNELRKEAKSTKTSYGYPIIIKMVDGKAQSLYDYSDIKNIYSNEEKMSEWLSSKI